MWFGFHVFLFVVVGLLGFFFVVFVWWCGVVFFGGLVYFFSSESAGEKRGYLSLEAEILTQLTDLLCNYLCSENFLCCRLLPWLGS